MIRVIRLAVSLALAMALTGMAQAATLSIEDKGVKVDAGAMGAFVLEYPTLMNDGGDELHKIIGKDAAGKTATVKYEGGATLAVDAGHDGQITYGFDHVPADVKKWRVSTLVDFSFAQGGTWKFGAGAETPFPLTRPTQPHLYQGNITTMQLKDAQGRTIAFHMPDYSYEELNDNRAWNWSIFAWYFSTPYNPDAKIYTVTIDATSAAKATPLVDPLGQSLRSIGRRK